MSQLTNPSADGMGDVSTAPLKTIQEIQFGILSPREIEQMSVREIKYPETLDKDRKHPQQHGLSDPALGTIDRNFICGSCKCSMAVCPGHFGHIKLNAPVFHPGFLSKVKKLLETVCHSCGKILSDESNQQFLEALRTRDAKRRFLAIHRVCKTKTICEMDPPETDKKDDKSYRHGGCGNVQPSGIRKDRLILVATYKKVKSEDDDELKADDKRLITPEMARDIFHRIPDQDLRLLGLNTSYARPEWMVISVLPVPPPAVRPSVSVDGGAMRSEDDLTFKLADIIRTNLRVKRDIELDAPKHITDDNFQLLQYHVATFMDNSIAGVTRAVQKKGKRELKTLRSRLKGKEGRLRGNLMGKRVDFSARTVITGDANLDLDQVGVPTSIAMLLTFPETVTRFNIEKLAVMVANGPEDKYPGARYVIADNGHQKIDLRRVDYREVAKKLQTGWVVERHLIDEDYIIFNRQPSLHKESMMGHRVKVMPYSTFRLNLSVTTPYNADFDGDEMNLHVPQTYETRAEVEHICAVPLSIVSPQANRPLMGIVQDSLCGIFKICRRDNFLNKDQVMNTLPWIPDWDGTIPPPAIMKPVPRWTGKQIISLALPAGLNLATIYNNNKATSDSEDTELLIQQGKLMVGLMNKRIVGVGSNGIIHNIYNELGWEAAVKFFNAAQRVVTYWLLHNGFSIGIGDTIPDPATTKTIQNFISQRRAEVEEFTRKATSNTLDRQPGMSIRQTFENLVSNSLNSAREDAGVSAVKSMKHFNGAVQMSTSGSKGSDINVAQMSALVGQQIVEGKRIPFGFSYRSLPHFTRDDYSPESRGFVENSYLRGLTPEEFFFHAMAGREGLIDTAVKTAETGYIQRRLVKALEDVKVEYDGTVRNSLGDIVEFIYGEDGLDAQLVEKQKVDIITCSDALFEKKFKVDVLDARFSLGADVLEQAGEIAGDREVQKCLEAEYKQLEEDRKMFRDAMLHALGSDDDSFQLPLNIARTIETAKSKFRIRKGQRSDLHPIEAITKVRQMLDNLVVIRGNDILLKEAQIEATMLIKAYFRSRLAFKRLVVEHSLNKLALDNILGDIENRFLRAQVSPGEMVGVLAAQSIGEPATQMTLNTFHYTGISSKNVTLGVPRLKEILNLATSIKTPSMTVCQVPENRFSMDSAKRLRSQIEYTTLRSVTDVMEIYYDPKIDETVIEADVDKVVSIFYYDDQRQNMDLQSRWLLRLVLNNQKLLDKGLTMNMVQARINRENPNQFAIIVSEENAEAKIVRIRMKDDRDGKNGEHGTDDIALRQIGSTLLDTVHLCGLKGVSRVYIDSMNVPYIQPDGSIIRIKDHPMCTEINLNTTGTAFKAVLPVDGVDPCRTYSNSFPEILETLGIEACRRSIAQELLNVLSFDGSYVNHRHLSILVDVMCARGTLMAITRHGINRADNGALMRCSFEETVEVLLDAAAAGEIDDCRGISENVMLGQLAPLGTGSMDILVDREMMSTAAFDNPLFGLDGQFAPGMTILDSGSATPYDIGSPMHEGTIGASYAAFSPIAEVGLNDGSMTEWAQTPVHSNLNSMSPFPISRSPYLSATSPFHGGAQSPYTPASPGMYAASPAYSPTSPGGFASPSYANARSPGFASPYLAGATSPAYSPTSPSYSLTSPSYSPTSPAQSYSPRHSYSPTSPNIHAGLSVPRFSPKSPYSPTSPTYSPTSPYSGERSPTSPAYSPSSPRFSPTSPLMGSGPPGRSASYSPTSPAYSPTSPSYSPTSPRR